MMQRHLPPDQEARRRAKILLLAGIVLGVFVIGMAYDYIDDLKVLAEQDPAVSFAKLQNLSAILMGANAILSTVFAIYFSAMAWRAWINNRFPPPNMKVIRTTRVYTGAGARIIALLCLVIALLLLSTNILLWRFHQMLGGAGKRQSAFILDQHPMIDTLGAQFSSKQERFVIEPLRRSWIDQTVKG